PTLFGPFRNVVGYPLNGLWQRPILSYADANKNGILEQGEVKIGDTAIYRGPSSPTKELTMSGTLGLFRDMLRISSIVDWRGGDNIWDYDTHGRCGALDLCASSNIVGAPLDIQAARVAAAGTSSIGYFYPGRYMRWRELSITSRLPASMLRAARS